MRPPTAVLAALLVLATASLGATWRRLRAERRLSMTDPVTSLANRRGFQQAYGLAWARLRRHGIAVGVVFADLERFKLINDLHGHAAGDQALAVVAEALQAAVRSEDLVCRIGGDEFVILLDGTSYQDALAVGERLKSLPPLTLPGTNEHFSINIGVAFATEPQDLDGVLEAADREMYETKRAATGR